MNQSLFGFDAPPVTREVEFQMACQEQPRHRLESFGVHAASDTELVAMVLHGCGSRPEQDVATAARLIAEAGSIGRLLSWAPVDYCRINGVSRTKGLQLAAVAEIGRRMMRGTPAPILIRPEEVAAHLAPVATGLQVEKFWVLCLNRRNRLIKQVEISSGTASSALAHPREVFRSACQNASSGLICVHNHPSGDPSPSSADISITRQLREAARVVDIDLIDHVILGSQDADPLGIGHYSFRRAGLL